MNPVLACMAIGALILLVAAVYLVLHRKVVVPPGHKGVRRTPSHKMTEWLEPWETYTGTVWLPRSEAVILLPPTRSIILPESTYQFAGGISTWKGRIKVILEVSNTERMMSHFPSGEYVSDDLVDVIMSACRVSLNDMVGEPHIYSILVVHGITDSIQIATWNFGLRPISVCLLPSDDPSVDKFPVLQP